MTTFLTARVAQLEEAIVNARHQAATVESASAKAIWAENAEIYERELAKTRHKLAKIA